MVPLRDERRLRYQDWVAGRRALVRELSDGRLGYLHIPDMVGEGWAHFHRDLRTEMLFSGLVMDVRGNSGGHISQLVVEKLARRVIAWEVGRGVQPVSYPYEARRGPLVTVTDEFAGSDGDIVTAVIRLLGLGPVVGTRTWGGVIGIEGVPGHELVDGTHMTVPRYAFSFEDYGWGVENYGVDPDVEVLISPDDWAAGRDPQLETAVRLALEALEKQPPADAAGPVGQPPEQGPPAAAAPAARRPALRGSRVMATGYLRYPHVHGDLVTFVAGDDVWLAPAAGGRAWRLSADDTQVSYPRFSRDGTRLAWTSWRDGQPEVYTADPEGGDATRLTFWGDPQTRVTGWTAAGEVLAVTSAGQQATKYRRAFTVPGRGDAPPRLLPYGPVNDLAIEDAGTALLTASVAGEPAFWKRYRGGRAGKLWIASGPDPRSHLSSPLPPFTRILTGLGGQLASPMLIGGRLFFLSDHEGTGNIYSCALDGTGLARHTDHEGAYARNPSTDGRRIVYHVAGDIWMLDGPDADTPYRIDITLGAPAAARAPRLISAADHLGDLDCDRTGQASVVEVRGTVHWLTHRDGPARALHVDPDARARLPRVLGETGKVVWVTDAAGPDALEIASVTGGPETVRLAEGALGFVLSLLPSPDGTTVAVATHDGRLLLVDIPSRQVTELAASDDGAIAGLAWSPDSAWLAWSQPGPPPLRRLRLAQHDGPPDRGGDRRAVRGHRSGVHRRRPVPGLPVRAQFRPGLRRAVLRHVVSVRQPPVPGAARGGHPVAVRAAARGPAGGRRGPGGERRPGRAGRGDGGRRRPAGPRGAGSGHRGPLLRPASGQGRPGLAPRPGHRRARRGRRGTGR